MEAPVAKAEKLFTRNFLLICLTTLITFTSFFLLLPTLPIYVLEIGGREADVGIIFGAVTVTSVVFRPIIGIQSDRRGRRTILLTGLTGSFIAMAFYTVATSISSLAVLRFFHGIVWAASTTSLTALIADIAPPARRGEAIGYFGISSNIAMAIGPALAMIIINSYSFVILFTGCAALALISFAIGALIPETRRVQKEPKGKQSEQQMSALSLTALFPSIVAFFITISYGSIVSFLPLYAKSFGVDNSGLFFTIFATMLLLSRPLSGRLSDGFGRGTVALPGIVLMAIAMAVLAQSGDLLTLALVAILFGLGFGAAQPALMALAVDRVDPPSRGAAMGYFTAAYDLGIGAGAIVMGFLAQSIGYSNMYLIAALSAIFGILILVAKERRAIFVRVSHS